MSKRAIIVGGGIMGLCTAWALRRDGWGVKILEQDSVPNPRGSSVDRSRVIRHTYGSAAGYMRMVDDGFAGWDLLWADLGETLYHNTGVLAFSCDATGWVVDSIAALRAAGRPHELLTPAMMMARFPMLKVPDGATGVLLERGGILFAGRIVAALGRLLADAIVQRRVVEVMPERCAVRCDDGSVEAGDLLVVAAGPWGPKLLPGLASRVTPSRQVVAYYEAPAAQAAWWGAAPLLLDISAESGFWAFPPADGAGVKVGDHSFSLAGDPDDPREPTEADVSEMAALCRPRLVDFDAYRFVEAKVCFYDCEPEEKFVIEPLAPHCWVMSGFSGHGFKFGAALGLAVARAAGDADAAASLPKWAAGEAGSFLA